MRICGTVAFWASSTTTGSSGKGQKERKGNGWWRRGVEGHRKHHRLFGRAQYPANTGVAVDPPHAQRIAGLNPLLRGEILADNNAALLREQLLKRGSVRFQYGDVMRGRVRLRVN